MSNASIDQLRDLHLPPPPGWWPPAPGWWIVLVLTLAGVILYAWRRRRARPLRLALRELDALLQSHAQTHDSVALARGVSTLLHRYARTHFPEARTEGLTGAAWLAFLDAHGGRGEFATGAGLPLGTLPYRAPATAPALSAGESEALVALAGRWLRSNAR